MSPSAPPIWFVEQPPQKTGFRNHNSNVLAVQYRGQTPQPEKHSSEQAEERAGSRHKLKICANRRILRDSKSADVSLPPPFVTLAIRFLFIISSISSPLFV